MAFYNGLPLFGPHLKSDSRLKMFSVEEQKKLQADYRDALGIGKNTTFSADAFDTLAKGSIRDVHLFEKTKGPGNVDIHKKLTGEKLTTEEDKEAAKAVRDAIDKALKASPEFNKAQTDYTESVATFRQLADKVPGELKARALIDLMAELKDDAIKAIKLQQKNERALLEEQFKDENFKANLSKVLSLNSPSDIDVVKGNMLKDLEANQKKQLKAFEDSTTKSETTLHKAAAAEQSELLFIANLHKNNAEMRQRIIDIAEQKRQKAIQDAIAKGETPPPSPPAVTATIGASANGLVLSGITMADIGTIKTLSGKYDIVPVPGQAGSYTMDMGSSALFGATLFNPGYYQDPRQNVLADFTLMAQAVRASGYEKIKLEMDFEPEEVAKERARQAYEAAINTGFPRQVSPKSDKNPDNIVIMVNGKEMRADELFKGHESELQRIHGNANRVAEELKSISQIPKGAVDLAPIKNTMNEIRAANKQAKQEAENQEDEQLDTSTSLSMQ
ncbi:hypothetical protein [Legionella maioricensis]|uniref:Coiled coil domain-containing protein n=1 Tax=Legionella maioricensis TaxID=2896528 RepID=A0A9X2CXI2_9GAMM|nr:hypothetical protein [Legionella maioricensis]MCL9682546.1 hypothetical protein [Legionella maioricensis]MCL9686207.1 hypothetical protein [Legionella maioricensis]